MGALKLKYYKGNKDLESPPNSIFKVLESPRPRKETDGKTYQYGFNGQERDDEVSGSGNSYTAQFWQYDSRLGRRWNTDPVIKHHESPYASFGGNPVWFTDANGADTSLFNMSTGSEITSARKYAKGKTPIYYVDKVVEGESNEDLWNRAKLLTYNVGANSERKGITGNSFRKNHPLFGVGTDAGGTVYEEDLLDATSEFNNTLYSNASVFSNWRKNRGTSASSLMGRLKIYSWFDDDEEYDLKSGSRSNLLTVPRYTAITIGEWSFYSGRLTRYDDYGNIAFGYWVGLMGLPMDAAIKGGASNQESKNYNHNYVGDDPRDEYGVKLGYKLLNK
jgi:RHS repeat-associated protein